MSIKGLTYIESALPEARINELTDWFFSKGTQKKLVSVTDSSRSRRVLHYGYKYNYKSGSIHEETDAMPTIVRQLLDYIPLEDSQEYFNQCIINRYQPGQGISAHIDRKKYGDTIVCFTFGMSGREMQFSRYGHKKVKIYTTPGSLYIMQEDARYKWKHSMIGRYSDVQEDGEKIVRKVCFSVTFRNVPPKVKAIVVV